VHNQRVGTKITQDKRRC